MPESKIEFSGIVNQRNILRKKIHNLLIQTFNKSLLDGDSDQSRGEAFRDRINIEGVMLVKQMEIGLEDQISVPHYEKSGEIGNFFGFLIGVVKYP